MGPTQEEQRRGEERRRPGRGGGRRALDDPDIRSEHEAFATHLSQNMYGIRERLGWSLERWAEEAGLSRDTLQQLEQGRGDPQVSTLLKLAKPVGGILALLGVLPRPPRQAVITDRNDA